MDKTSFKELYNKISKSLLNKAWLKKNNISKIFIENNIKKSSFMYNLGYMVKEKNYSCEKTLDLCIHMMNNLLVVDIPDNWLKLIYNYTLQKTFPEAVSDTISKEYIISCELYLRTLRVISIFQEDTDDETWQSKYPLKFLSMEEEKELEHPEEYAKFLRAFRKNYTYEMMKLSTEVMNYNTLDHICGVHYLSLFIARQIKEKGIPIDLGRVSGAAAGHDIGKYGCKGVELKRVPYLHYYYTDLWFKRYKINYIRNIAINHSTWDLELENLSLESLILIYCDFRVKNKINPKGAEMNIFTLKDSFDVILSKLDNVTEAKQKRYKKVYSKLKDFEDFLFNLGINTNLEENTYVSKEKDFDFSLVHGNDIIKNIKYLAINHNISLMYQLRDEYSLDKILQYARSEKSWKNLREYIRILEEYSTYLTQKQKLQTIKFLYDNLIHPEDDIRKHCAELIGLLISMFDEDYRKEIPPNVQIDKPKITSINLFKKYLNLFLKPEHKIIPSHRLWIAYETSTMINSLFTNCKESHLNKLRKIVLEFFKGKGVHNAETKIYLLTSAAYIPLSPYVLELEDMFEFIKNMFISNNFEVKVAALETIKKLLPIIPSESDFRSFLNNHFINASMNNDIPVVNFLILNIATNINSKENFSKLIEYCNSDIKKIPEVFLSNLKSATHWIIKKNQIDLLLQHAYDNIQTNGLHTTIHFCNLLKVSAVEGVRNSAGSSIIKLMPYLTIAERNEVAIELLRALEIEGHRFTEYIPRYLGQILLWLQPKELDEIIDDLVIKVKNSRSTVKSLLLKTIGIAVGSYPIYKKRFIEKEIKFDERLLRFLGILLNGLGDYNIQTKLSSFSTIGKEIFGCETLTLEEKSNIFKLIAKKLLTLITNNQNEGLLFLTNSAGLNHIYRFISDYTFKYGNIDIKQPNKVAFFPGTFDPFSLSHKEITTRIRDLGFEIYLSVDEFSWSKRTLPNKLRRNIINMSIADEFNIYIYPDKYQTNISNASDLKRLKNNFPNSQVYIVVGSDVILNASCYKTEVTENSIHSFPHIIFERGLSEKTKKAAEFLKEDIIYLQLPSIYSDISSTQIRTYIDNSRDISSLIDPLAQRYIYDNGFYQREPLEKYIHKPLGFRIQLKEKFDVNLINELAGCIWNKRKEFAAFLKELTKKQSFRMVIIREECTNEILAFSSFYWIRSGNLYSELKDDRLCKIMREKSVGRIILINGIFVKHPNKNKYIEQLLITETLAFCVSRDYEFAIFKSAIDELSSPVIYDILKLVGFKQLLAANNKNNIYLCNISTPCVINFDLENLIKEPFRSNSKVVQIINDSRKKLQESIAKLYPGQLTLYFDNYILYQKMIKKICKENHVSTHELSPRKLGNAMCVPYGDILDRYIIPNTVTKSLHTEKLFNPDMKNFRISSFPHYLDLPTQIKMIKSFSRPVILVDNLLHKGYRMQALDPLLKAENIEVKKIITGILSGRGKDLMDKQKRKVDSVYFIPRLKIWFNENALYPFIGGDALWRGNYNDRNLLPSINQILPYTYPSFIRNTTIKAVYNMSKTCIENAILILNTLENEYHTQNGQNLTLLSLGDVFTIPRCTDRGKDVDYDLNLSPTHYLQNDLEVLERYENIFKQD